MTASNANDEGAGRALAWVEHLRSGGSTPWIDFRGTSSGSGRREVPGAAQLELARRLNAADPVADGVHRELVDRILSASVPGRGQLDLDLVGVPQASPFGAPPVDPADIAPDELIRVAVGALAEALVRLDPGAPRKRFAARLRHRLRHRRPWRRGLRLAGDPLAVAGVRAALARRGHITGRRRPVVVVLADDLGVMLADIWTNRLRNGRTAIWAGWLEKVERNDALPPALELPDVLERKAAEVGAANVHVVVGDPGAEIARLLGLRMPLEADPPRLPPDALEVVREVNAVLRVLVHPERHRRILHDLLLPRMADGPGIPRGVPAEREDWVRRQAERLRTRLSTAGYRVHGDLDDLLPREGGGAPAPSESRVLDVALRTLLKTKECM
ncbi:MAG: hypothetical protein L0H93_09670 [Nocardioides sp.]|nr:hypothetical protein [Nocardioides sp.]